jgi:hypothetical protein
MRSVSSDSRSDSREEVGDRNDQRQKSCAIHQEKFDCDAHAHRFDLIRSSQRALSVLALW